MGVVSPILHLYSITVPRRQASEVLLWVVDPSAFSCEAKPPCAAHIPHDDVPRSYLPLNLPYIIEI